MTFNRCKNVKAYAFQIKLFCFEAFIVYSFFDRLISVKYRNSQIMLGIFTNW